MTKEFIERVIYSEVCAEALTVEEIQEMAKLALKGLEEAEAWTPVDEHTPDLMFVLVHFYREKFTTIAQRHSIHKTWTDQNHEKVGDRENPPNVWKPIPKPCAKEGQDGKEGV